MHLDSTELTVRGAFRARAPLASLRDRRADGDALRFRTGAHEVALILGPATPRWAAAIAKPPPTLAAKLGIAAGTRVLTLGTIDDDGLAAALATGTSSRASLPATGRCLSGASRCGSSTPFVVSVVRPHRAACPERCPVHSWAATPPAGE